MEFLVVIGIMLVVFLSLNIAFIDRGGDVSVYARNAQMQEAVEKVAGMITAAHATHGLRVNTTLPSFVEGCEPVYTVHASLFVAVCGDEGFASGFIGNVTNGTSSPPFSIREDIAIKGLSDGRVEVTQR